MNKQLMELNEQIEGAVRAGEKSLFRCALELGAACDGDPQLREALEYQKEHPAVDLVYLRMAYYFFLFFERSDGKEFRALWRGEQERETYEQVWERVYGWDAALSLQATKARAWMLSGRERGAASDVWRALKLCCSKETAEGVDRFSPEAYANEDAPPHLPLVLALYQQGAIEGREFADFIELCRRSEGEPTIEPWMETLLACYREHFCKHVDCTLGSYLFWSGGEAEQMSLGVGFKHIKRSISGELRIGEAERRRLTLQPGARAYPTEPGKVSFKGLEVTVPESPVGVYYRDAPSDRARQSWWQLLTGDNPLPYRKRELLIVRPATDELTFPADCQAWFTGDWRGRQVRWHEQWWMCYHLTLTDRRPKTDVTVQLETTLGEAVTLRLAGEAPHLVCAAGAVAGVSSPVADGVVSGEVAIELAGLPAGETCAWRLNGEEQPGAETTLRVAAGEGTALEEIVVEAVLRRAERQTHRLRMTLLRLPQAVAAWASSSGKVALPEGWEEVALPGDAEHQLHAIELRINQKRPLRLRDAQAKVVDLEAQTGEVAWWFEDGLGQRMDYCQAKRLRSSDLADFLLCVPEDLRKMALTLGRQALAWSSVKDGVLRLPLGQLPLEQTTFCYAQEAGRDAVSRVKLGTKQVVEVVHRPRRPTLCQREEDGAWGVFLPQVQRGAPRESPWRVVAFCDELTQAGLLQSPTTLADFSWRAREAEQFLPLEALAAFQDEHPRGEILMVLKPANGLGELPLCCLFVSLPQGSDVQVVRVQTCQAPYAPGSYQAIKMLREAWRETLTQLPEAHPLRQARLCQGAEPLAYGECEAYWRMVRARPELWADAFEATLNAGYNPLMEPAWFNRDLSSLGLVGDAREQALEVLLDNHEVPQAPAGTFHFVRGQGLCAAWVARERIIHFEPLEDLRTRVLYIAEQQRLRAIKIDRLGIKGKFGQDRELTLHNATPRSGMQFELGANLQRDDATQPWRQEGWNVGRFQGFAFVREQDQVRSLFYLKMRDIDPDGTLDANFQAQDYETLYTGGKALARELRFPWLQELFIRSMKALHQKGMQDKTMARLLALVVCLQSVLSSQEQTGAWKRAVAEGEELYQAALRVTRVFFQQQRDGDGEGWREVMRFIVEYLGIYVYLDIDPKSVQ